MALALGACTERTTDATPSANAITEIIAVMPDSVDPLQRQVLDRSAEAGEVTFEQYADAVRVTIECVEAAGFTVDGPRHDELRGLPALTWGYRLPDGAEAATADEFVLGCQERHSLYIELAYSGQPRAIESEAQLLEQWRPDLVACMRRSGLEVDEEAPIHDLVAQATDFYVESDFTGTDCVDEIGMHG